MNEPKAPTTRVRGYGLVLLPVLTLLLSATGRPFPKAVSALAGLGLSHDAVGWILHLAPVALLTFLLLAGRAVARGRSGGVRWAIYGAAGAIGGFAMAFCLDLFAATPDLFSAVVGPLAPADKIDFVLWVIAGTSFVMGLAIAPVALIGRAGLSALQVEEVDAECLDVRRAERALFGLSAIGMLSLGLTCAGLAVARQAGADVRTAGLIVSVLGAFINAAVSYRLWTSFDELQRRNVVNGYATSGILATIAAFFWALAQAAGIAPPLDGAAALTALLVVQYLVTSFVTNRAIGQFSAMESAA